MKKRIFVILIVSFIHNTIYAQDLSTKIVKTYKNGENLLLRNE